MKYVSAMFRCVKFYKVAKDSNYKLYYYHVYLLLRDITRKRKLFQWVRNRITGFITSCRNIVRKTILASDIGY